MPFPRQDEKTRAFFVSVLPDDPRVELKPMFGHVAGFVNGNMFAGTFGSDIMMRLPDEERAKLIREEKTSLFEPMEGRPMKEYVVLPRAWHSDPERVRRLLRRSLEYAATLPAKALGGRKKK